jgi:large subunit ribosomal protein L25
MADKVIVKAEKRVGRGKNDSRRLRVEGKIPVVVYGGGGESVAGVALISDLAAVLRKSGHNAVFTLDMEGEGTGDVMFQDRQIDPLKGRLVHADLRRIAFGEKMEMTVSVHLVGEAEGLSEEGAVLNQPLHEIKILVEPSKVPESIEVDVTNLKAGDSIHISDIKFDEGIEVLEAEDTVVVNIVMVKEEELEPQLDAAEPEVIGEKGEDEAGE